MTTITRRSILTAAGGTAAVATLGATNAVARRTPVQTTNAPVSSAYDTLVLSHQPKHYFRHLDVEAGLWVDVVAGKNATFPEGYGSEPWPNGELAPHFDGYGQHANAGDSSYFGPSGAAGAWTMECWFSPDTLEFPRWRSEGYVHVISKGGWHDYTDGNREWILRMYNEDNTANRPNWVSGYAASYNGGTGMACGQAYTDGLAARTWHHVVFIVSHATRSVGLWFDGVQAGGWVSMDDPKYAIELRNGDAPLLVGIDGSLGSDGEPRSCFQGSVAKLAFYTAQMSQERITAHYEASPMTVCQ